MFNILFRVLAIFGGPIMRYLGKYFKVFWRLWKNAWIFFSLFMFFLPNLVTKLSSSVFSGNGIISHFMQKIIFFIMLFITFSFLVWFWFNYFFSFFYTASSVSTAFMSLFLTKSTVETIYSSLPIFVISILLLYFIKQYQSKN